MHKALSITGLFVSLFLFAFFVATTGYTAQNKPPTDQVQTMPGTRIELRANDEDAFTFVAATDKSIRQPASQQANIEVAYNGFSPQAQAAFQYAVDIWEAQLSSPVTIRVEASWEPLDAGVLGSAGPNYLHRNFPGAPQANTWYSDALADKLAGLDQKPGEFDLITRFNSDLGAWYLGTDGNAPSGQYDLVTVVLHELGHGLGFGGSATVFSGVGQIGFSGLPRIYDRYVENGGGQAILDFANPSISLGSELRSNNLYFNGSGAVAGNGGSRPRLYAPSSWQQGSSYSHLDENTFGAGDPNSLMTPSLSSAEAIHDPGDIVRGMFTDLGWSLEESNPTPTPTPTHTPSPTNTPTRAPYLSLSVSNEPTGAVEPGVIISYMISYENDGEVGLTGVEVKGDIPENTTFVEGSASNGAMLEGGEIKWTVGELGIGSSGEEYYTVQVDGMPATATPTVTSTPATATPTVTSTSVVGTNTPVPTNTPTSTPISGENAIVVIGSGSVSSGGSVTIPLEAFDIPAIALGAVTIDVQYDSSVVRATACEADPNDLFDFGKCNAEFAADTVRFTAISAAGVSGDLLLADITFEGIGASGENSPLLVEADTFTDPNGNSLSVTEQDGLITIQDTSTPTPTNTSVVPTNTATVTPIVTNTPTITPIVTNTPTSGGNAIVQVGSGDVNSGDSVTIPLEAFDIPAIGLGAAEIDIQYNSSVVTAVACDGDPNGSFDLAQCNVEFAADTVRLALISVAGVSGDHLLANITFQGIGASGESSILSVEVDTFTDPNGNPLSVTEQDGSITIQDSPMLLPTPLLLRYGDPLVIINWVEASANELSEPIGVAVFNGGERIYLPVITR